MDNRLIVGNLLFSTSQEQIKNIFGAVGEVLDVTMPVGAAANQLHIFVHVTMGTPEEALSAIISFNGMMLNEIRISVNPAQESPPRGDASGFGGGDAAPGEGQVQDLRKNWF